MGEATDAEVAAIRSVLRLEVSVERVVSLRNELGAETIASGVLRLVSSAPETWTELGPAMDIASRIVHRLGGEVMSAEEVMLLLGEAEDIAATLGRDLRRRETLAWRPEHLPDVIRASVAQQVELPGAGPAFTAGLAYDSYIAALDAAGWAWAIDPYCEVRPKSLRLSDANRAYLAEIRRHLADGAGQGLPMLRVAWTSLAVQGVVQDRQHDLNMIIRRLGLLLGGA